MRKDVYAKYRKHHVCSDIHFNHKNIALYCPKSRGQFVEVIGYNPDGSPIYAHHLDKMNETIIARWNSKVQPTDHTFILGDVAMGVITKAPALVERLNGAKTLICGNHDRGLLKLPEIERLFIDIRDYACFGVKKIGVVMSHFPFASWDGMSAGAVHLHGHLHGSPCIVQGRIKDVGIDTNDLYPYDFEEVLDELMTIPKPTTDHHGDAV